MNCSIKDSIDISYNCTQTGNDAQRLGRKMVHMKNSSKKKYLKSMSRGGKINIYVCLIIEAKHILMFLNE